MGCPKVIISAVWLQCFLVTYYNYADKNTVSCYCKHMEEFKLNVSNALNIMRKWFYMNGMKANRDEFHLIFV